MFKRIGVETTYYDPLIGAGIATLFKPNTRAVFTEAPGSQTFEMQDIPAIAKVAHDKGAVVLMDNTWATPLYFHAFEKGVDLSIQAGTKYIGGHSDIMFGCVSANATTLPALKDRRATRSACASGRTTCISRCAACARWRVRLARHQRIRPDASRAGSRRGPEVRACCTRRSTAIPATQSGSAISPAPAGCSASCSSRRPRKPCYAFMNELTLFGMGFSWGGFESLVILFDCAEYRTATKWAPGGPTLRFHIGLEDHRRSDRRSRSAASRRWRRPNN